jgi:molecular chaperone GrpE
MTKQHDNDQNIERDVVAEDIAVATKEALVGDTDRLANLTPEELVVECQQALQQADENWNKLVRLQAEMENVRRRAERDVSSAHKFGSERLIKELLPVADSLERGLESVDSQDPTVKALYDGMVMTLKLLQDALTKNGIKEVNPMGEPFNAAQMEVISLLPNDKVDSNTVIQVIQKGYLLNDRLLRPAMVVVSQ